MRRNESSLKCYKISQNSHVSPYFLIAAVQKFNMSKLKALTDVPDSWFLILKKTLIASVLFRIVCTFVGRTAIILFYGMTNFLKKNTFWKALNKASNAKLNAMCY